MSKVILAALAAALCVSATPSNAAEVRAAPIAQEGLSKIVYVKGTPTVDIDRPNGDIRVTPLENDHGRLSFGIGLFNKGANAANFGIETISASIVAGDLPVAILSKDRLAKMARSRAGWAQFAVALAGGLQAASAQTTYNSTTYTPRGTYSTYTTVHDSVAANMALDRSAAQSAMIQGRLNDTMANLSEEIIQTTTVQPGAAYGGRIVLDKFKVKSYPQQITLLINWNGDTYPFTFTLTKG